MAKKKVILAEDKIKAAAALWQAGVTIPEMAERLSLAPSFMNHYVCDNRDIFPARRPRLNSLHAWQREQRAAVAEAAKSSRRKFTMPDRVTRITREGVSITMPRVTFIDGPAP